jgi:hypothetical protein
VYATRERATATMSQQAEVVDEDESRWEHVQQEPAQELVAPQRHQTLPVLVGEIAPAESDYAVGERDETVV